jgi:cob(I)alamin adenosyltransferase
MVRITKVHTGIGDGGKTRHLDGTEVSKGDARLEVIGAIDELNSVVGIVRMEIERLPIATADGGPRATVIKVQTVTGKKLARIQQELFDLGAECSTVPDAIPEGMQLIPEAAAERLVTEMDEWLEECEPLTSFILPTGSASVANLHLARVVARRAERRLATLRDNEGDSAVRGVALSYINRISDWFFVLSRWITGQLGEDETLWEPIGRREPN